MSDNDVIVSIEPAPLDLEKPPAKALGKGPQQHGMAAGARSAHRWPQGLQVHRFAAGAEPCASEKCQMDSRAIGTSLRDSMLIVVLRAGESSSGVKANAELKPVRPAAFLIDQPEGPSG